MSRSACVLLAILSLIVVGSLLEGGATPARAREHAGQACARLVDPLVPSPLRTTDYYVLRAAQLQQGCDRIIGPRYGEPYTVTNTHDSGPGSLRHAILSANVRPGLDTIVFAIASAPNDDGLHVIQLQAWLPPITEPVIMAAPQPDHAPENAPVIVIGGIQIGGD